MTLALLAVKKKRKKEYHCQIVPAFEINVVTCWLTALCSQQALSDKRKNALNFPFDFFFFSPLPKTNVPVCFAFILLQATTNKMHTLCTPLLTTFVLCLVDKNQCTEDFFKTSF